MLDESQLYILLAANISLVCAIICWSTGPRACVTGMLLLLSFGNIPICFFSPSLPSPDSLVALQGIPFGYTAIVAAFVALLTRSLSPVERRLRRGCYLMLGLITLYGLYGVMRNGPVASLIYYRMFASPFLMMLIGCWAASQMSRKALLATIKTVGIVAAFLVFTEVVFPTYYLDAINYPQFHSLKTGEELASAESAIFARERRFFNMREFEHFVLYKPAGPTFNYPSGSYMCFMGLFAGICLRHYLSSALMLAAIAALSTKSGAALCLLSLVAILPFSSRPGRRWAAAFAICAAYVAVSFAYLSSGHDLHSYSLMSSIREFPHNPYGQGLGYGGAATVEREITWDDNMIIGESGVAIALNMMGACAAVLYAYYLGLIRWAVRRTDPSQDHVGFAAAFLGLVVIGNSVLQELAVGPYGLGMVFLIIAVSECERARLKSPEPVKTNARQRSLG